LLKELSSHQGEGCLRFSAKASFYALILVAFVKANLKEKIIGFYYKLDLVV